MSRSVLRLGALALLALALTPAPAALADPDALPGGATHVVDVFTTGYKDHETGTIVTAARVGDVVRFVGTSGIHTVTEGAYARPVPTGGFESGFLRTGESWTLALDAPGVFPYTCRLHPDMNGAIVVSP